MDSTGPKTRRESKKDQRQKARGNTVYTAKHVRQQAALAEKRSASVSKTKEKT